jgi:WD40 repeat protein
VGQPDRLPADLKAPVRQPLRRPNDDERIDNFSNREPSRELRTLKGHSSRVNSVAVSSDGRQAVSAAADHTVKLWELNTGEVLATFTCDGVAAGCALGAEKIVAGDVLGRIHFLCLELRRDIL